MFSWNTASHLSRELPHLEGKKIYTFAAHNNPHLIFTQLLHATNWVKNATEFLAKFHAGFMYKSPSKQFC